MSLQLPRPWDEDSEHRMVQDALTEVEAADRLGFDYRLGQRDTISWRSSLAHTSRPRGVPRRRRRARTRQIHVGHAVVLSPPGYNPPARVAERIAMLDLVSSGRCRMGRRILGVTRRTGGLQRRSGARRS